MHVGALMLAARADEAVSITDPRRQASSSTSSGGGPVIRPAGLTADGTILRTARPEDVGIVHRVVITTNQTMVVTTVCRRIRWIRPHDAWVLQLTQSCSCQSSYATAPIYIINRTTSITDDSHHVCVAP